MDAQDWIARCAARLRRRWPTLAMADLEATAAELYQEERWRSLLPETAAYEWLCLGALAD